MPILLVTGPAHSGKERAMLDVVRAHHARGRRPLLVVPTRADAERCVGELADCDAAARVVRFDGLLAEIVRCADTAPPALGALARERLLATLFGRAGRGVVRSLGTFVGELRVRRVSAARLTGALNAWVAAEPAAGARARRLGALYEGYERALRTLGRSDAEQRAIGALDALRREPARWRGAPVLFCGFDDLTPLQLDAIETLGALVGVDVAVSLAFERGRAAFAGRAHIFQMLRQLAAEHRELPALAEHYAPRSRRALHHLERQLFESAPTQRLPAQGAVRLLEGGSERGEIELVAQEIAGLLRGGMAAEEIAIVHRAPATIAELLEEVLGARGIPHTLRRRVRFADTALGAALLGALHLACEPDVELEHLLRWLRVGGEREAMQIADELEARARRAGATTVSGARALWDPHALRDSLLVLAPLYEAPAAGVLALIERATQELERLGATSPLLEVSRREVGALEAGRAVLRELQELVGAPESRAVAGLAPDAAAVIATLRGLELDVQGPLLVREGFVSTLGAPVAAPADTPPRGGGVAVLDPLELRGRPVRALFLCGLQEGVFPAPARTQPLLSEEERRRLVESSGLLALAGEAPGVDALAAERYCFYSAVSRPRELLALSWHAADDDGLPSSRSLFVDDVCDLFAEGLQVARERRMLDGVGEGGVGVGEPAPRIAALREQSVLAQLRERHMWSASALEAWASCPVRWLVQRLLDARDLDPDPEPLARGGLAHAALRDTLEGLRRETGSARLRPAVLARARQLLAKALAEHEHEYPLSVAPERVPGARRRLRADLERYLEHAAVQQSPLEPTHLELSFGFPEEPDGLPALQLGDGVSVRGRIDRVDVHPGGAGSVVYDYKGARAPDASRWTRERSLQVPLYMRALEDAQGGHVAGGFYQPLSGRDLRARGALEADSGIELDCVRGDTYERAELAEIVRRALDVARESAAQARAGELQPRPATCGFGESGCMYPEICRCER